MNQPVDQALEGARRDLAREIENLRAFAARCPKGSRDRTVAVALAKALEDCGRYVEEHPERIASFLRRRHSG